MLAEWSTTAGSYHSELLGMLAVRMFPLTAEDYYRESTKEQTGNTVSCNNMGALHTFAGKKQVPASNSNTDIRRALREVNRRAHNKYSLEHMKGHQDRTARAKELSPKTRLNVECNETTKEAVRGVND